MTAARPLDWSDILTDFDLRILPGRPWAELEVALVEALRRLALAQAHMGGPWSSSTRSTENLMRWWARSCAAAVHLHLHGRLGDPANAADFAHVFSAALSIAPTMGRLTELSRPVLYDAPEWILRPDMTDIAYGEVVEAFAIQMAQYVALHDQAPRGLQGAPDWLRLLQAIDARDEQARAPWRILRQEAGSALSGKGLYMLTPPMLVGQMRSSLAWPEPPYPLEPAEGVQAPPPAELGKYRPSQDDLPTFRAKHRAEWVGTMLRSAWHTNVEWMGTLDLRPFLEELVATLERVAEPSLPSEDYALLWDKVAAFGHYLTTDGSVLPTVADRYEELSSGGRLPLPAAGSLDEQPPAPAPVGAHTHADVLAGAISVELIGEGAEGRRDEGHRALSADEWLLLRALRHHPRQVTDQSSAIALVGFTGSPVCVISTHKEAINLMAFLAAGVLGGGPDTPRSPIDHARAAIGCVHAQLYQLLPSPIGGLSEAEVRDARELLARIMLARPEVGHRFGGGELFQDDPETVARAHRRKLPLSDQPKRSPWRLAVEGLTPPALKRWLCQQRTSSTRSAQHPPNTGTRPKNTGRDGGRV